MRDLLVGLKAISMFNKDDQQPTVVVQIGLSLSDVQLPSPKTVQALPSASHDQSAQPDLSALDAIIIDNPK
jgi:hypothetical protein